MPRPRLPWIKLYKQILHSEIMILPEAYRWNFIGLLLIAADEPEAGTIRSFWMEKNGKVLASKLQTSEYILGRTLEELEKYSIIFQKNGEIIFKNYHIYQGVSDNKPEKQTENNQKMECLYRDKDRDRDKEPNSSPNKDLIKENKEPSFLPPSLKELVEYFLERSEKEYKDCNREAVISQAKLYFSIRTENKWIKANKKKVKNWKLDAGQWILSKRKELCYGANYKPKPAEDRRPEIIKEELLWRTTGTPLRICADCGERSAREETANSMLGLRTRYICDDCKREFSADEWSGLKQAEKREDETLDEFAERRAADFRREIDKGG